MRSILWRRSHDPKSNQSTRLGIVGVVFINVAINCGGLSTIGDAAEVGSSATEYNNNVRPLSSEWLSAVSRGQLFSSDQALMNLAAEFKRGQLSTDASSHRTASEILKAISADNLLARNSWSSLQCSKHGCILAIQSIDPYISSSSFHEATLMGRLLAYLTPRMALSLHPDKAVAQINSASKEIYLVFFLFPDAAIAAKTSSEESGQPDMQKASVAIQNDLDAAQKAAAASQWDQALEYLKTAGEEEGRSVRDAKMILETQGSIYAEMRRNTEAQASYEKALRFATLISTADTLEVSRRLLNLLSPSQQPLKSIELGRNLAEHGVATAADMAVISRSYFALKDCKYTTQWADKSIQAAESAGESSDSMLYELKAECDRAPFPFGGF